MTWLSQFFGFFKSFQCWITIAPWESALRVRVGRTAVRLGPGVHFRVPFMDRIFVQATRLRPIFDAGQTVTTKDGKVLTVACVVYYAIQDMLKMYQSVSNPESVLIGRVQGVIARVVTETISEDLTPAIIEAAVAAQLPNTDWGLDQVRLEVTTFAYVRTYRIMNYAYQSLSAANDLETPRI
jgi:regulator of protease activity HflC (stomatin/prohibitin superfamily)